MISFNFGDPPFFGLKESDSPIISSLDSQGSLMLAGLKNRDKVISIDGVAVSSTQELVSVGRKYSIGQTVTVEFERNNKLQSVPVKLVGCPE